MTRRPTRWDRLIAFLLFAYPREFRRRFGADLAVQYTGAEYPRTARGAWNAVRDFVRAGTGARLDDFIRAVHRLESGGGSDLLRVDLRYTLRRLFRAPVYAATIILTLGLAAGLNVAVFAILDATLVEPLPYRDESTLVSIGSRWTGFPHSNVSLSEYLDYAERARTLSSIGVYTSTSLNLTAIDGPAERVPGTRVTPSFFEILGVQPVLGRVFGDADAAPAAPAVAVLSHALWRRRFGSDRHVIGRQLRLDSGTREIVGVMPPQFQFPNPETEFWIPAAVNRSSPGSRGAHAYSAIGRLAANATLAQARDEMSAIGQQLQQEHPTFYPTGSGWDVSVRPLREQLVGDFTAPLTILMTGVAFVLLIACANAANVMLVRASGRASELATQAALGAPRFRLVTQVVVEGMLLGAVGGAFGLVLGGLLVFLLTPLLPERLVVPASLFGGARAAAFGILVTVSTGALAGATIARPITKIPSGGLRASRSTDSKTANRLRNTLTVVEIALAVVLLVGGGVALRSFGRLMAVDPGLSIEGIATARITLSLSRYPGDDRLGPFFDRLLDRITAMPGVSGAGAVNILPLTGARGDWGFGVEGYRPASPGLNLFEEARVVAGDYFHTLGIRLVRGRLFDGRDSANAPRSVVVSELLARKYWGDTDPVGRRMKRWGLDSGGPWATLVGVVSDVRTHGLATDPVPILYFPLGQIPQRTMTIVAASKRGSTSLDPLVIASALRAIDPEQPAYSMMTLEDWVARSVSGPRFNFVLLNLLAVMALALAAVGVYGVMAFGVSRRVREMGIRAALGATPASLVRLVLRQSFWLAAAGIATGSAGSLAIVKMLETLLPGARSGDLVVLVIVSLGVMVVALVAGYVPARRTVLANPIATLNAE